MARKSSNNGPTQPPTLSTTTAASSNHRESSPALSSTPGSPERPKGPLSIVIDSRDSVKVNNANLTELKNACDDALKRYLSHPDLFKQSYQHTDIRLALGWSSVFVAAGTAFYGYKFDFEEAKPVVWVGLILYIFLTTLQTLYSYFVEGNTVFVGRRKTFSKRIITDRITVSSQSEPAAPNKPPAYQISLNYLRSTSSGKSLLGKGKTRGSRAYSEFFDEHGNMEQERFEKWVGELVESAMEGKSS